MPQPRSLWLHRFAVLTAAATFCLILAGSLVTSTASGLAVPDWPLSYGTWFPPMEGGIFYEHGHRMIAGAVGLMIVALAVWIARAQPSRWLAQLGWAAAGAVVVQALLGGLTVLLQLPPQISIAHAVLAQAVFCLTVCLAHGTAPAWAGDRAAGQVEPRAARLAALVGGFTVAQVVLGAVVRHTGHAVMTHLTVGCLLALHVGLLAKRLLSPEVPARLRGYAARLLALVGGQLLLGFALWTHRGALPLRTLHVAAGALISAQVALAIWETARHAHRRPA